MRPEPHEARPAPESLPQLEALLARLVDATERIAKAVERVTVFRVSSAAVADLAKATGTEAPPRPARHPSEFPPDTTAMALDKRQRAKDAALASVPALVERVLATLRTDVGRAFSPKDLMRLTRCAPALWEMARPMLRAHPKIRRTGEGQGTRYRYWVGEAETGAGP